MNRRNLLVLLVILIALGSYVYLAEIRRGQSPATETSTAQQLWTMAAEDVVRLEVEQPVKASAVRLTYYGEIGWQCLEPSLEATDQERVKQIISQLVSIRANRVLSETNEPLSVFGLAAPGYIIRILPQGKDEIVLRIGDKNPQGTAYYAQIGGQQPIYLLPTYALDQAIGLLTSPPVPPTPTPTATPVSTPSPETTGTPTS
ncbi:MAG: DUF4340 domain-containing protein [Anaerolineae bacterium]|nr:DUF4340 domain-containing protein [Anaerolineae bacterium]MDH7473727.1 DUF4340 domain-containing protein [Anaerolineae bacterium]